MNETTEKPALIDEFTAIFGVLLAIYSEIKCKNDIEYYETCYRNAIMNKNDYLEAIKKARNEKNNNEGALVNAFKKANK